MTRDQLVKWRESLNLTQVQAASELHIPVASYREWEQGRRRPHKLLDCACRWVTQELRQTFGTLKG